MDKQDNEKIELTGKQKIFCHEYIIDWNATRAAKIAGYSEKTATVIGSENLIKPYIKAYIADIQINIEKEAGISKLSIALELKKIGYSDVTKILSDWITRKDFNILKEDNPDIMACIQETSTRVRNIKAEGESTSTSASIEIEEVKIKFYSKIEALRELNKMFGHYEAEKIEHKVEIDQITGIQIKK